MLSSLFCYLWLQQQPIENPRPPDSPPPPAAAPSAPDAPPDAPAPPTEGAAAPPGGAPSLPDLPPAPPPSAPQPPPAVTVEAGAAGQQSVRPPGSSLLNPALSLILDGTFGYYGLHADDFAALGLPIAGDDPSDINEGFGLQEIEIAATAAIDPYLDGAIFLTIPNLEGIEVEEAYLVTTSLPANLQLKAGTFRSQVGRNNTQHLHMQNFTRRPLMTALLFGADGFRGPGAQASVLLPLPWFATLYGKRSASAYPRRARPSRRSGAARARHPRT